MSSMRNAVQRRNHKERAQPRERERWGLLEKHKDYALRAKDYNEKKKKLKTLRQKATERNPDEFHFAMMSHRMQDGGKTSKTSAYASMPHATAQLLKTQDAGYLRTMIQSTRKERQRLREELVLQRTTAQNGFGVDDNDDGDGNRDARSIANLHVDDDAPLKQRPRGRHTVFVDDRAQQRAYDRRLLANKSSQSVVGTDGDDEDTTLDTRPGSNSWAGPGGIKPKRTAGPLPEDGLETRQRSMAAREQKLEALRERENALVAAEQELELQRAKMSNSVGGVTKAGHRFKIKERKK